MDLTDRRLVTTAYLCPGIVKIVCPTASPKRSSFQTPLEAGFSNSTTGHNTWKWIHPNNGIISWWRSWRMSVWNCCLASWYRKIVEGTNVHKLHWWRARYKSKGTFNYPFPSLTPYKFELQSRASSRVLTRFQVPIRNVLTRFIY